MSITVMYIAHLIIIILVYRFTSILPWGLNLHPYSMGKAKQKTGARAVPADTPISRRSVQVRFSPRNSRSTAESTQEDLVHEHPSTPISPDVRAAIAEAVTLQMEAMAQRYSNTSARQEVLSGEQARRSQIASREVPASDNRGLPSSSASQEGLSGEKRNSMTLPNASQEGLVGDTGGSTARQEGLSGDQNDQSLQDVLQTLLAQDTTQEQSLAGMSSISCDEMPLDIMIPEKIKDKIRNSEYVDLAQILFPNKDRQTIQIQNAPGHSSLRVLPTNTRKLWTIEQWTRAMHIYGSIYLAAKPNEVPAFFKYLEFIRNLARSANFLTVMNYDELFRRTREKNNRPWDRPLVFQYMQALSRGNQSNMNNHNFTQSHNVTQTNNYSGSPFRGPKSHQTPVTKGVCFRFQQSNPCVHTPCPYQHKCQKCNGNHPAAKCFKDQPKPNFVRTTITAKPK